MGRGCLDFVVRPRRLFGFDVLLICCRGEHGMAEATAVVVMVDAPPGFN